MQQGFAIGQPFLNTMAADYGSGVRTVDFTSPSAIALINAWVRTQTADRIQQLFDSLDPSTKLVLANAVYLKAIGQRLLQRSRRRTPRSRRRPASRSRFRRLHQTGSLGYTTSDKWQGSRTSLRRRHIDDVRHRAER